MKNVFYCLILFCMLGTWNTVQANERVETPNTLIDTTYISAVHCEGQPGCFFNGANYPPGVHTFTLTGSGGMDSVVILECSVLPIQETFLTFEVCEGEELVYNGSILPPGSSTTFVFTSTWGCDSVVIVQVEELAAPIVAVMNVVADQCGNCSGSIDIEVLGGLPPFQYSWSDGAQFEDRTGLCAGNYFLTLTDVFGCTASTIATVPLDTSGTFEAFFMGPPALGCAGECNYAADLALFCGTPPYTYDWNDNALDGIEDPVNLCEGFYSVTVTDGTGATATASVDFVDPPALVATLSTIDVSCDGNSDGSMSITVSGGVPPYDYLWPNGISGVSVVNGLPAGNYDVTIIDNNGCGISIEGTIVEPSPVTLSFQAANVSCNGDGNATAVPSGGAGSYIYIWNTGETTPGIIGLQAGTYTVSVQDVNGCVTSDSVIIAPPFQLDVSSTFADCDSTGGTATVVVDASISNPVYAWSNGGTQSSISNVSPGWYSVTVSNPADNCQTHKNILVPLDTACFVRISGFVYNDDVNRDCIVDATTEGQSNILVELSNGDLTFTDQTGYYEFNVLPGNFDINLVLNGPGFDAICGATIAVNAPAFGGNFPDNNFYLKKNGIQDLRLKVNKRNARPGFTQWVNICVMNPGTVPMNGTLTFVHDPIQEYLSTTRPFTNYDQSTQTITWDFTNHPAGVTIVYRVDFRIPVGTPLGQGLSMYFKVDPISGDLTPADNEINCDMLVTGSYDPNDKQVIPEGIGDEGGISMQDTLLSYQIRFQNTGTDTAFTVVLRDTLDDNLDPSSVVPGPSSHPYELTFLKGNILEFTFNNIMLPDSFVNEPASNGFVFFDVKWKAGLEYGDMMKNTAAIYFDFNEPIITNTVTNTLRRPVGINNPNQFEVSLFVNPNPVQERATIEYELEKRTNLSLQLYDLNGRHLREIEAAQAKSIGSHQVVLEAAGLLPGQYIITLEGDEGVVGTTRMLIIK